MSLLSKILFGNNQDNALNFRDIECLNAISKNEGMSVTALAKLTGFPLSEVTSICNRLSLHNFNGEAKPLLLELAPMGSERDKCFSLTQEGKAIIRQYYHNSADVIH